MREIELEKAQKKLSALAKDAVASEPTIITRNGERSSCPLTTTEIYPASGLVWTCLPMKTASRGNESRKTVKRLRPLQIALEME